MTEPHWYLSTLGVDPVVQGRGIGGGLMQNVFEQADEHGVPCYLETQKESNVQFYEHHGFRVLVDDVHPESGIPVWTMRRDPRESA
jgi:GNAT superfamily N-acetyltransferase